MDSAGRAYIAGNEDEACYRGLPYTFQSCFPTTSGAVIGGTQTVGGDPQFAFVAAFDPTGAHLLYSTLFGDLNFKCTVGCGGDTYGTAIAVDQNGYFYLVGETMASNLPTTAWRAAFRNAVPGDTVQLFATGLAPSPTGTPVTTTLWSGVTVTIGSVTIPASAAALVAVGEFQINFTVPRDFASMSPGLYPISISLNGVTSPASINSSPPGPVVIPIQH